jgi:cation diffusion facilitator family transporter
MSAALQNYSIQKKIVALTVCLFLIKIAAWYMTHSIAILTDALEYTINVISGFVGLYSLYLSAQPRDNNHPYGHGKAEFLSAAIEGTLMVVSSFLIIYEAIDNLVHPHTISKLDAGIFLIAFTAILNYLAGAYALKQGTKNSSLALVATGKHLQSDTYATIGITGGLILMYFTHYTWLDSLVALIFAGIIILSGYQILRSSIAGIMDEADDKLLDEIVALLQTSRSVNWIDLHNLRIIKYGGTLHLDCHITVPWYLNVNEAHAEVDALEELVKSNFGQSVELFVHTDGCHDFSCKICSIADCKVRQSAFEKRIDWNIANISTNSKHHAES